MIAAGQSRAFDMDPFQNPEIWRNMLESLPAGVCVLDLQKRIVLWSGGAERLSGHLRHDVIGHSCVSQALLHCDQPGCEFCDEHCPAAQAMRTSQGAHTTGFLRHRNGHEIPVRIRAVPVHNEHGSVIGALETFEELQPWANREEGESNAASLDCRDPVTGTASRAMMQAHLQARLASLAQRAASGWVLLVQIRGLAHFRASLGAEAASSLLRVIARTIESFLRTSDRVGRWSDDEFLLIVDASREETIDTFGERIRRVLAGEGIEWWGERRSLPLSTAVTLIQSGDSVQSLLQRLKELLSDSSASGSETSQES